MTKINKTFKVPIPKIGFIRWVKAQSRYDKALFLFIIFSILYYATGVTLAIIKYYQVKNQ